MRKGSASILGIVIALVLVMPASAGSLSFDPAGGSTDAVVVVENAITSFSSAFSARAGCIGSGSVIFELLSGRKGEYRTAEATVVINPDRATETMASTVFHELAHHAMLTCRAYRDAEFTAAFYAAQGIPAERGWFDGAAGWDGIPAEHFAEAAVVLIQGSNDGRIPISTQTVDVVRRWLNGQPMPIDGASDTAELADETVAVNDVNAASQLVRSSPVRSEPAPTGSEPAPTETQTVRGSTAAPTEPSSASAEVDSPSSSAGAVWQGDAMVKSVDAVVAAIRAARNRLFVGLVGLVSF